MSQGVKMQDMKMQDLQLQDMKLTDRIEWSVMYSQPVRTLKEIRSVRDKAT